MATISLSRIHPDYGQIRAQLQLALAGLDTWKDLLPTATGQAVIDFVAAVGDMDQYGIEHAYREAFLSARKSSSVYAIAKMLGVRLARKVPAAATVSLSRKVTATTLTIPAYTVFNGGGVSLFNREPVVFNIGVTSVPVQLYEGQVKELQQLADGSDFQAFIASERDFTISDADVQVLAGNTEIPVTQSGLWTLKGVPGVQDLTQERGELLLVFGNDIYGYKPVVNTLLTFRYVVNQGASANSARFTGQSVTVPDFADVKGVASTGLTAGANERDPGFYRRFGPQLFSSSERAVTEDEFQATAVNYPSVVDALIVGQRRLSPSDNRYMNLVRVSLLTNSTWGTPQREAFLRYYQTRTMFPTRFYFEDPSSLTVDVEANVYCRFEGDLNEVQAAVQQSLATLFAPRAGIIGLNFFKSDIEAAIRTASPHIEFFELLNPVTDVYPMFKPPKPPIVTEVPGGGTLAAGPVAYAVTVMTPLGETLADNIGTQVLAAAGSAAHVEWNAIPGALGYRVYGRSFPGARLLATTAASATSFTDVGFPLTTVEPPVVDTSGVRYCTLGNTVLNMFYTARRLT